MGELPEGVTSCPHDGCGAALVFCPNAECGQLAAPTSQSIVMNNHGGDFFTGNLAVGSKAAAAVPDFPTTGYVAFAPDPHFADTLRRLRPVRAGLTPGGPAVARGATRLAVEPRGGGRTWVYAVAFGEKAALGRGGLPDVDWCVQPEPMNQTAYTKISRAHLSIELRHGYVFVVDRSTMGTRVNDRPLTKLQPAVLADGDDLALADGVVRFRVRVQATAAGVYAVALYRRDLLADRLTYVLIADALPVQLDAAEVTFASVAGATECRVNGPAGWQAAPAGGRTPLPAAAACWADQPRPQTQADDLAFRVPG